MNQTSIDFDSSDGSQEGDAITLAHYAERAYLEYALSVVKGRALPDVCDGQKLVQRRILFAMERMGLAFTTASGPKAVKSARVVGDVLGRFQHMGVEVYNFVSSLNCILAQRLIRVLCPKCKRPAPPPTAQELEENDVDAAWLSGAKLFDRVGCVDCHGTGFRGRQAIIEFMGLNDELRELLIQRAPVREVKAAARRGGMQFLRDSALEKVRLGLTTFAEINKVTFRDGA